jgi:hypothetical protein
MGLKSGNGLFINYPGLKAGVIQDVDILGFSPMTVKTIPVQRCLKIYK